MAYNQTNFINLTGGQDTASETFERVFQFTDVLWMPRGGIVSPSDPTRLHILHQLCSIKDLSTFSSEIQNQQETVEAGKAPLQTDEGTIWSSTVQFKGDDILGVQAITGKLFGNTSTTEVIFDGVLEGLTTYGTGLGDLYLFSANKNKYLTVSTVFTDCELIPSALPGATNGDNFRSYTINCKGRVIEAPQGFAFCPIVFYDDGTNIANAAAPDGLLTTFNLKDGNYALNAPQTAALLAQVLDPEAGSPQKYLLNLRLNGTVINSSQYTFNQATGVITFTSAPADGAKIEVIVLLPTGFQSYDENATYRAGQVRKNDADGVYYICSPVGSSTTGTFVPADWTALTGQNWQLPYWANLDGLSFEQTAHPEYPLFSWTLIACNQ